MKFIIKSMLFAPTKKKLLTYQQKFRTAFRERDPQFDAAFGLIEEFHQQYDEFISWQSLYEELTLSNDTKLQGYIETLVTDVSVPMYAEDTTFFAALDAQEKANVETDLMATVREMQTGMATQASHGTVGSMALVDAALLRLNQIRSNAARGQGATYSTLRGAEDVGSGHSLREIYETIKQKAGSEDALYFDSGIEQFKEALFKDGDLVFVGGYTSQGKSILLRHWVYRQVVHYGRNSAFFSFEMSHDVLRVLFAVLHANNKDIFPGTPAISYKKFKRGELTAEEDDFLFKTADHDLRNNPAYGTLHLEQPNKPRYRLSDLQARLREIETTIMRVRCCGVDYLTQLYPRESDRGQPERSDYNTMISTFKNMCLTHRDARGNPAPFLGLTAAQISRGGYTDAVKLEGIYEIKAFSDYNEIERSADHLFTSLMTPEMRATNQIRYQHLKNRDGVVVQDPVNMFCDFDGGFQIAEVQERSANEMVAALRAMQI